MSNNVKKTRRTIYMSPSTWEYLDEIHKLNIRTVSEELEYLTLRIKTQRETNDAEAIKLATPSKQPQKKQQ